MNIRDLEYIAAVATLKHFGKAAEFCHISQPTLSMQIKKCEDALGIRIFERLHKSVVITPDGEFFLSHANEILSHYRILQEMGLSKNNPLTAEVRFGVFPTLGPFILPTFIPHMFARYKDIKLFLVEEKTPDIETQLIEGRLDCALLGTEFIHKNFESQDLFFDPFLVALPNMHRLAAKKSIVLEDLQNETVLLLEEGHCLRSQALQVCDTLQSQALKQVQATSLETIRYMVSTGLGITFVPASAAIKTENLIYRPLKDQNIGRRIRFVFNKGSYKVKTIELILDELRYKYSSKKLRRST